VQLTLALCKVSRDWLRQVGVVRSSEADELGHGCLVLGDPIKRAGDTTTKSSSSWPAIYSCFVAAAAEILCNHVCTLESKDEDLLQQD